MFFARGSVSDGDDVCPEKDCGVFGPSVNCLIYLVLSCCYSCLCLKLVIVGLSLMYVVAVADPIEEGLCIDVTWHR